MNTEWRTCKFCKRQNAVYLGNGEGYLLFKYGVRHYAHAICLAINHGVRGGREAIPEHERKDYDWRLSLVKPDGWELSKARVMDDTSDRLAAALGRAAVRA